MKTASSMNLFLLAFCLLLMAFVFISSRVLDHSYQDKKAISTSLIHK